MTRGLSAGLLACAAAGAVIGVVSGYPAPTWWGGALAGLALAGLWLVGWLALVGATWLLARGLLFLVVGILLSGFGALAASLALVAPPSLDTAERQLLGYVLSPLFLGFGVLMMWSEATRRRS